MVLKLFGEDAKIKYSEHKIEQRVILTANIRTVYFENVLAL